MTAQAPLIETTTSSLGANIDPRQVSELPSQGRNWMSLALLAPGNRTNAQGALPVQDRGDVREFQLNVDGLQVTSNLGTGNQSRYSNDSIAEFQFISNRFDATQGRSSGVQVNAITKSGTNTFSGSLVGNFRNSDWNAADPVLNSRRAVLEPADQRCGGRPDCQEQAALLRQLRIRAPAADLHLANAVPGLQRHAERHQRRQAGRRACGSAAVVEDASDGEGEPLGPLRAVWRRHVQPSVRDQQQRRAFDRRPRSVHAGPQQPGGERLQGGVCVVRHQPGVPDVMVEPLAGAQRHHDRWAEHHLQGLFDGPEQQPPALPQSERVHVPRRFLVFVRRGGPSRPEGRRRVSAPAGQHAQLQPVRRGDYREQRPGSGQHRADPARIRSTPTPGPWRSCPGSRPTTRSACRTRRRS